MSQSSPIKAARDESTLLIALVGVIVLVLAVLLLLLFASESIRSDAAEALGIAKHSDHLIVYDATCWQEANTQHLYLAYWSADTASLVIEWGDDQASPVMNGQAGVQTLDLTLRDAETCPTEIFLVDQSRKRVAGSPVQGVGE